MTDCEYVSLNLSPFSFNVSTRAAPFSLNVSRKRARLRVRVRMIASSYSYMDTVAHHRFDGFGILREAAQRCERTRVLLLARKMKDEEERGRGFLGPIHAVGEPLQHPEHSGAASSQWSSAHCMASRGRSCPVRAKVWMAFSTSMAIFRPHRSRRGGKAALSIIVRCYRAGCSSRPRAGACRAGCSWSGRRLSARARRSAKRRAQLP